MNPATKTALLQVQAVHPTLNCLPANILRAHIVFDRPMRTTDALRHIKLIDNRGNDLSDALLDLTDGLWTTDGRILTLLFHPGRVKTGLAATDQYGSIFTEDQTYQLVVSKKIVAANGRSLEDDYRHCFKIGSAIRQGFLPIPDRLLLRDNIVRIEVNQLLDFLSVRAYLAVADESDRRLNADISLTADARAIVIRMSNPNSRERRFLRVHSQLEDVAGNRANVPFEISQSAISDTLG